jgi:hypothetical protein
MTRLKNHPLTDQIDALNLSTRTKNAIVYTGGSEFYHRKRHDIAERRTVDDLCQMTLYDLFGLPGLGLVGRQEVFDALQAYFGTSSGRVTHFFLDFNLPPGHRVPER